MIHPLQRYPCAVIAILLLVTLPASAADPHAIIAGIERFGTNGPDSGLILLGELGCTSCHGVSKNIESHLLRKTGPVLDGAGARVRADFVRKFLADPHAAKPGTTMPDLLHGLTDAEKKASIEALTHFILSKGTLAETRAGRRNISSGQILFSQVGCVACHGSRETKAPLATSVPLPDLAAKYSIPSLAGFLLDPLKARPTGRMPGLNLTGQEAQDIAQYLLKDLRVVTKPNLNYQYFEGSWDKLPDFAKIKPKVSGICEGFDLTKAVKQNGFGMRYSGYLRIETAGQYRFFLSSDDGSKLLIDDKSVIDNDGIHPNQTKNGVVGLSRGAHKFVVDFFDGGGQVDLEVEIQGPGFSINDTSRLRQDASSLISLTQKEATAKQTGGTIATSGRFSPEPTLVFRGQTLFTKLGCASCHQYRVGEKGLTPELVAKPLSKLNPGVAGCLSATPPVGLPAFKLSAAQQSAIKDALTRLPNHESKPPTPEHVITQGMIALNCYACHERGGIGGVEQERNAAFETTQKEMGDEGRIPPRLDGISAKLKPSYLSKFIAQGGKDRPYMLARMPRFGSVATSTLANAFANGPKLPVVPPIAFEETSKKVKSAGRQLVGSDALSCVKCHTFNGSEAEGIQAIDMTLMTQRLNRDWFHRYVIDPPEFRPGTRMPTAWPNGKTIVPHILGGGTSQQVEAVWDYLSDGASAVAPAGLGRQPMPLFAIKEAVIYRNFIAGAGTRAIGVGYPERANLAFDANGIRYALIWQGGFMDASRHWNGRGVGFQPPMGDNVIPLPDGPAFASLSSENNPWPTLKAKELGYIFKGYSVTPDQRPTFLYQFGETKVEDHPIPKLGTNSPGFKRVITLKSDHPPATLYFRAAVADAIKPLANGGFQINGEWTVAFEGGVKPSIRHSNGKMELILSVKFVGKTALIVEHFDW